MGSGLFPAQIRGEAYFLFLFWPSQLGLEQDGNSVVLPSLVSSVFRRYLSVGISAPYLAPEWRCILEGSVSILAYVP